MMLKKILIFFIVTFPASIGAFSIGPVVTRPLGYTLYRIKFSETSSSIQYVGKSELAYPLNAFWTGAQVRGSLPLPFLGKNTTGTLTAASWMNTSAPLGNMTDRDWVGTKDENALILQEVLLEISSTESTPYLLGYGGVLTCRLDSFIFKQKMLTIEFEYEYDFYKYDIKGISGWQLYDDTTSATLKKNHFSNIYPDESVLAYHVTWNIFSIKFIRALKSTRAFIWEYNLALIPLAFAFDEDDHLLRGKRSNALTFGMGLGIGSRLHYLVHPHVGLELDTSLRYVRTKGTSTQTWYRDEYYDEFHHVSAGTLIKDIDTWIISLTGSLKAALVVHF